MKKLSIAAILISGIVSMASANTSNNEINLQKELKDLKNKVAFLEKEVRKNNEKVAKIDSNDHLYWNLKLQSNYDFVEYKTNGNGTKTNNVLSNQVEFTAKAEPAENLKAVVKIEANNIWGMNGAQITMDNSNWVANETPDDTNLRVKEAYFTYHFGPENSLMFSVGRRPATDGYPANLRDNVSANSPVAHLINLEFDGASFKIGNEIFSSMSDTLGEWGTWMKLCAGRGYSSNTGKYSQYPYSKDNLKINDFAGFLFVPYDDGQYSLWTETVWSWNVKGYYDTNGDGKITSDDSMEDSGNYFGENILLKIYGIGDGISDYLDDTRAFISLALSKTYPKDGQTMLGSSDSKVGRSIWIGMDMPGFDEDSVDRWGWNFVAGSKYWRPMTYSENTLTGSIAAVRGKAFEVYYNHNITDNLSAGIRYTSMWYNYTGSDAFFGDAGTPLSVDDVAGAVKSSRDIHAYIRYNF